jgi:predicted HTH transcriptional regulator
MPEKPEDGRREVSDEAILNAVRKLEPKATTTEIAQTAGFQSRQGADYRLRTLKEQGRVASDMVGRTKLWTVVEDEEDNGD